MAELQNADIPESYFEYAAQFDRAMFDVWTIPNRLIEALYPKVRAYGVGLGDITWDRETTSARDLQFVINVPRLRATLRLGLEAVVFNASNPDWTEAPALLELFEHGLQTVREVGKANIASQEISLILHVNPAKTPFGEVTASLVDVGRLGKAQMYGIAAYDNDWSFVIDKSLRFPDALFIRLNRRFLPSIDLKDIAVKLYEDENRILAMIGLQELME